MKCDTLYHPLLFEVIPKIVFFVLFVMKCTHKVVSTWHYIEHLIPARKWNYENVHNYKIILSVNSWLQERKYIHFLIRQLIRSCLSFLFCSQLSTDKLIQQFVYIFIVPFPIEAESNFISIQCLINEKLHVLPLWKSAISWQFYFTICAHFHCSISCFGWNSFYSSPNRTWTYQHVS